MVEVDDDLLAAAPDGHDPAPGSGGDERRGVRITKRARPSDARVDDHRPRPAALGQQVAPEVAGDGLDLGKLRHRS